MLRAVIRYLSALPHCVLDVLAPESSPAAGQDLPDPAPAGAQPAYATPIFGCPYCGEALCCRLMAEQLTDNEWNQN